MSIKERALQIKQDIPTVYLALRDKNTPLLAKIIAGLAVIYALSPIDLIPDFIPILGLLDDLIILPILIGLTIKLIPKEQLNRCREEAKALWPEGQPKKWAYAIPFLIIWGFVIVIVVSLFI